MPSFFYIIFSGYGTYSLLKARSCVDKAKYCDSEKSSVEKKNLLMASDWTVASFTVPHPLPAISFCKICYGLLNIVESILAKTKR